MSNPLKVVLYGAYLFWKHTFYGIRNETNDKEVLFNIVCSTAMLSLFTCLDLIVLYVVLFKKNEYTSLALIGNETIGTLIVLSIPLLMFIYFFLNKEKYIHLFQNLEKEKSKKFFSLICWIVYMIIPIIALILIP